MNEWGGWSRCDPMLGCTCAMCTQNETVFSKSSERESTRIWAHSHSYTNACAHILTSERRAECVHLKTVFFFFLLFINFCCLENGVEIGVHWVNMLIAQDESHILHTYTHIRLDAATVEPVWMCCCVVVSIKWLGCTPAPALGEEKKINIKTNIFIRFNDCIKYKTTESSEQAHSIVLVLEPRAGSAHLVVATDKHLWFVCYYLVRLQLPIANNQSI